MESCYRLSASLHGHDQDVRAISPAYFPVGSFLSGSRDRSAKLWTYDDSNQYIESLCLGGHQGFVTCICVMPPDDRYPHGTILTGSTDKLILAFTIDSPSPVYKLEGHADTVSALGCGKFGTILSGSWDSTAKVWVNQKNVITLTGHEAAVWCVGTFPSSGCMITGSADKTLKLWKAGKCEKTFKGHTDCVRGVAIISNSEFFSCANDATIRKWSVTGECITTLSGHDNYIYTIALLANGNDFVTGSEDRTVKIWKNGKCMQTIPHPTQTIWSVCTLPNGDIVTGASDGCIRIFSCDPTRMASEEELQAFDDEISKVSIPAQIGDIKTDDLPGPEVLMTSGKRDGQRVMVKDANTVTLHQWSDADSKWQKLGDIIGGTGKDKATYNGKEYDYVFDVDIQEGMPPLKLPYNKTDDPYMAAHKFLEDNEISQTFLDQVADFIMKQTKDIQIGSVQPMNNPDPFTGGGADPFTGGGPDRFTGSRPDPFTGGGPVPYTGGGCDPYTGGGPDPFTGEVKFVGGENDIKKAKQIFPLKSCISFDAAKFGAIINKLKELNMKVLEKYRVEEHAIESLEKTLSQINPQLDVNQKIALKTLFYWPNDYVFPVLDIIRLFVRSELFLKNYSQEFFDSNLIQYILDISNGAIIQANRMLSLRIFSNLFCHKTGQTQLLQYKDDILASCLNYKNSGNKNIDIALCTVLLNFSVIIEPTKDLDLKTKIISFAVSLCYTMQDDEAHYRLMMAIGTLCINDEYCLTLIKSHEFKAYIDKFRDDHHEERLRNCAKNILQLIN